MHLVTFLTLLGIVLLLEAWRSHHRLRGVIGHDTEPPPLERYPSISVIRPIRGLDTEAEQNIEAALDNGYPGWVETIFVFDDDQEPALPLALRAIETHESSGQPGQARVLIAGPPPPTRTGKLNAMIAGLTQAKGELIAFADSDIRPDKASLKALVETLMSSPAAGSAFTPVVDQKPPQTAGDAGCALMINGLYGPAAALASMRRGGEMPFIMGQFMVFKREALAAIGGLESADGQLVDDMFLGAMLNEVGYRNLVCPNIVPIIQEGLELREFWQLFVRWIAFSRSGLPGRAFKWISYSRFVVFWVGLLAAAVALTQGYTSTAIVNLLAPLAVASSLLALHQDLTGRRLDLRYWWVALGLFLAGPFVLVSLHLNREVSWRGRSYQLSIDSRLAGAKAANDNEAEEGEVKDIA